MTTGADVAASARGWIGTPWVHQARTRGLGCDCGGLVGGVALELGLVPANWWTEVDRLVGGYGRQPDGTLQRMCDAFMSTVALADAQAGDVALMAFAGEPQHLGILAPYRHGGMALVHALNSAGAVCEHRMSVQWWARVRRVYRMPGVVA